MNDTPTLAGRIRRDLYAIADTYDEALDPVRRASGSQVKASKEPPLPIGAHVLDVRREAHNDLTYWARFLIDEADITHGPKSLEVGVLVAFVVTWVDWLAEKMPDDADNLAADVEKHARALRGITDPPRKDYVSIGPCPLTIALDGESVECASPLRAFPGHGFITCARCGHEDTVGWWRSQLLGHRPDLVTAAELVDVLTMDLELIVSVDTVRQWFHRGKIQRRLGPNREREPWLYDWARVVADMKSPGARRTA